MSSEGHIKFKYIIEAEGQKPAVFEFSLNKETLFLNGSSSQDLPAWTKLDHKKCDHCPLSEADHPRCPIAKNIYPVIEAFKDLKSYTEVTATVEAEERSYRKKCSLQEVIASMIGIPMATSGCPHMNFLRFMAKFHLPFSSSEETYVRSTSMFLLRQYLKDKQSTTQSLSLSELEANYEAIKGVNLGIVQRIRSLGEGDADPNAIVLLHYLADNVQHMLSKGQSEQEIQDLLVD